MAKPRPPLQEAFSRRYVIDGATGCWNWTGMVDVHGYGKYQIEAVPRGDGKYTRHRIFAHRLAWELLRGPIPEGIAVCHTCDNPKCVNPDHLFLGTPKQNSEDMVSKGRSAKGERQGRSKLTDTIVREILRASGSIMEIAIRFGTTYDVVYDIKRRVTWRHITADQLGHDPNSNWLRRGSAHRGSVLTEKEIPIIRSRASAGEGYAQIAADYGVTRVVIRKIHLRKSWTHVP